MIPGVDYSVDFPSTYDVEELDLSHNPIITAENGSEYHPTDKDLDVKLPATAQKYQPYSCKQQSGCNFHVSFGHHHNTGLLPMKKCKFLHNGFTTESQLKVEGY